MSAQTRRSCLVGFAAAVTTTAGCLSSDVPDLSVTNDSREPVTVSILATSADGEVLLDDSLELNPEESAYRRGIYDGVDVTVVTETERGLRSEKEFRNRGGPRGVSIWIETDGIEMLPVTS